MPENGFLFPAFNDRSTDIHSMLYYAKEPEKLHEDFISQMFGCRPPISAKGQKEVFQTLIRETLGDECEYELVMNIHEKLNEVLEEHQQKETGEPLALDRTEIRNIFANSGVAAEKLQDFDEKYEQTAGEDTVLVAANITSAKALELKTPDIVIKVNPESAELVTTKIIDGRKCLVIEITDQVELNGIVVKP